MVGNGDGARTAPRGSELDGLGTCIVGPRIFDVVATVGGWESGQFGLEAAVSWLAAAGGRVETHRVDGCWRNTGRPEDLLAANRVLLDRLADSVTTNDGRGAEVEGRVLIDDTATIESSRVRGPSVIGPGARIVDSYVGPYTSVGEEAIIENSEVENAIIMPRATIEHFGLRVEESVIGEGAELRRTFASLGACRSASAPSPRSRCPRRLIPNWRTPGRRPDTACGMSSDGPHKPEIGASPPALNRGRRPSALIQRKPGRTRS